MSKRIKKDLSNCNLGGVSCPDHDSSPSPGLKSPSSHRGARQEKQIVEELSRRILQSLQKDPEKAKKAAKIIELWLHEEAKKQKVKKAG